MSALKLSIKVSDEPIIQYYYTTPTCGKSKEDNKTFNFKGIPHKR